MKKFYMQGGGKSDYSAPMIETFEISAEKGFAASSTINGSFGDPDNVGDDTSNWWQ